MRPLFSIFGMFALLVGPKAAGKHCCARATAFEKAMARCALSLQSNCHGGMKTHEFVDRPSGRGFRGKNQTRRWGPAED
jgi:hypothetical protein